MRRKSHFIIALLLIIITNQACMSSEPAAQSGTPIPLQGPVPIELEATQPQPRPTLEDSTGIWKVAEDPRFGLRLALPCFWSMYIPSPEEDPSGQAAISAQNYDASFIPPNGEQNGSDERQNKVTNLNIAYLQPANYGLPQNANLEEVANAIYPDIPGTVITLLDTEGINLNGQQGLRGTTEFNLTGDQGQFYLLPLSPDIVVALTPGPNGLTHPDMVQIINSIALSPDVLVNIPTVWPAAPPTGMDDACLGLAPIP